MKNKLWIRLTGAVLAISMFSTVPAFAANEAGRAAQSTSALMEQAAASDGADSEAVSYELYQRFTDDPAVFLSDLASQPDDVRQLIVQFIVWENKYDANTLPDILSTLSDLSADQLGAAEELTDYWTDYQAQSPETEIPEDTSVTLPGFDVQTIRGFIDQNLSVSDPYSDEAFCVSITQAYEADPTAFGDMISDLDTGDIQRLGGQIAYAVENNLVTSTLPAAQNSLDSSALSVLQQAIAQADPPQRTNVGVEEDAPFPGTTRSAYVPTIGTISYSGSLEVGKEVTLSVKISETAHTSAARSYYVVAMCSHSQYGTYYKKAEGSLTIPSGSSTATKSFLVTMSDPGNVYTKILVYSSNGGSLLTSRIGTYPDAFTGRWRIQINLNSASRAGYLGLYNASGTQLMYIPCLGRSESNADESVRYGNTPRGNYWGYLGGPDSNVTSYGPYKYVVLEGNNNPLVPSKRDGIWIHGGAPSSSGGLRVTHGCVRVSNPNQLALQNNITSLVNNFHEGWGNVRISVGNYSFSS